MGRRRERLYLWRTRGPPCSRRAFGTSDNGRWRLSIEDCRRALPNRIPRSCVGPDHKLSMNFRRSARSSVRRLPRLYSAFSPVIYASSPPLLFTAAASFSRLAPVSEDSAKIERFPVRVTEDNVLKS